VGIDAILPLVGARQGAPLRLETIDNEVLTGPPLLLLSEVGCEQLVPAVREEAEAAAGTAARLLAESSAESIGMVEELRRVVGKLASVPERATMLVVKHVAARLAEVHRPGQTVE
jgi:hypothetical protein